LVPSIFMEQEPQIPSLLLRIYFQGFDFFDESCLFEVMGGSRELQKKKKKKDFNSPARSPERQRGVLLVLDLKEHVEHHRAAAEVLF